MFSRIIQKFSARDINVAEHWSTLKNAYYSRFSFIPKTGMALPKLGVFAVLFNTYKI